jgi:hypothetical protein
MADSSPEVFALAPGARRSALTIFGDLGTITVVSARA